MDWKKWQTKNKSLVLLKSKSWKVSKSCKIHMFKCFNNHRFMMILLSFLVTSWEASRDKEVPDKTVSPMLQPTCFSHLHRDKTCCRDFKNLALWMATATRLASNHHKSQFLRALANLISKETATWPLLSKQILAKWTLETKHTNICKRKVTSTIIKVWC